MEELHKLAIDCLENNGATKSDLVNSLKRIDVDSLDICLRGYYHLYKADILGLSGEYQQVFECWNKHLQNINENEKVNILRNSDNCWWNLQLGDIANLIGKSSVRFYLKSRSYGEETVKLMEKYGDYKGILTHQLFLGYIHIKCPDKRVLISKLINGIKSNIELHDELKDSLVYEAKALILMLSGDKNKEKIKENLFKSSGLHLLYLHKRRCNNLLKFLEEEGNEN